MKTKLPKTKRGFTLIEVALVLAIAGLIFLMVFQVVPTVQRSQRDTARNEILGNVQSMLMQWQTNHNGNLPKPKTGDYSKCDVDEETGKPKTDTDLKEPACQFIYNYMNSSTSEASTEEGKNQFKDPDGEYFNLVINKSGVGTAGQGLEPTKDSNNEDALTIDLTNGQAETFNQHTIYIIPGAACNEDNQAIDSKKNNFAILYLMESSGVTCRGTNS